MAHCATAAPSSLERDDNDDEEEEDENEEEEEEEEEEGAFPSSHAASVSKPGKAPLLPLLSTRQSPAGAERAALLVALKKTRSFARFSQAELEAALELFTPDTWKCRDALVREGLRAKHFFVLVMGICDLSVDGQLVHRVHGGSSVGEAALTGNSESKLTATIVSPTGARTWKLEKLQFKLLIHNQKQNARRRLLRDPALEDSTATRNGAQAGVPFVDTSTTASATHAAYITDSRNGSNASTALDHSLLNRRRAGAAHGQTSGMDDDSRSPSLSPRVSPRIAGYDTLKWIKSRHRDKEASNALRQLQEVATAGDVEFFDDAMRLIFAEFHHDEAGTIPWSEFEEAVMSLKQVLAKETMRLVKRQWDRAQRKFRGLNVTTKTRGTRPRPTPDEDGEDADSNSRGGTRGASEDHAMEDRLDYSTFATVVRGFDFQRGRVGLGFGSLQEELRVREESEKSRSFTDFLRSFALRKKILNLRRPQQLRMARTEATQRLLRSKLKVASSSFTQVLRTAGARERKQPKHQSQHAQYVQLDKASPAPAGKTILSATGRVDNVGIKKAQHSARDGVFAQASSQLRNMATSRGSRAPALGEAVAGTRVRQRQASLKQTFVSLSLPACLPACACVCVRVCGASNLTPD